MYINGKNSRFSASDVSSHAACAYLTQLKAKVARGELNWPVFDSPDLDVLREKGESFEEEFLAQLKAAGKSVVEIDREDKDAGARTRAAMSQGVDYIYQARLSNGNWYGWADFLKKVDRPGDKANWSYEVLDTKLARETKAGSILQICLYSQILGEIQGVLPEYMHIKTPEQLQSYRVNDYMAYFRLVQKRLQQAVADQPDVYPEPVAHCDVCDWWEHCNKRRREDDHLSFIAGMGTSQIREVRKWGIDTLEAMARLPLPLVQKPTRGSVETYAKLREQARVQLEARNKKKPVFEILEPEADYGFFQLPAPTKDDVFLDLEGDPFAGNSGREYLFGWVYKGIYHHAWATTDEEEKNAFEDLVDALTAIRDKNPAMHIFHFAPYEPSAFKRLMGKYATRENEIDVFLRAGTFIDLHTITRQSIRAGVEAYSLKEMEKFHGFTRKAELRIVGKEKMAYECLLEAGVSHLAPGHTVEIVRTYNEDDCRSLESLQDWLEHQRKELNRRGYKIPRPKHGDGEAGENLNGHLQRIKPLFDALMRDLPFESSERDQLQQAKWLLANMLDWYRRELKSFWWEYFRLSELPDEDLVEERAAIGYLTYTGVRTTGKKSVVDKYVFPPQETDIVADDTLYEKGAAVGKVEDIDTETCEIWIKKGKPRPDHHPGSVFTAKKFDTGAKEESIIRLAEWVLKNGMKKKGKYQAARHLLLRAQPQTLGPFARSKDGQKLAVNWVNVLDNSILPIQGPPGAGKSHTAVEMILSLLRKGKKIGITALSHKVIQALLEKLQARAEDSNREIGIAQKVRVPLDHGRWTESTDNQEVLEMLESGDVQVVGATPFLWAREEFVEAVDYMFVDEAGQLSLIDTLALAHACRNLIMLGDPQQLKQPQQGSHPEGTEVSALEHILGDQKTIHEGQGVFLDLTWRMHSSICAFNSELFYEDRLVPKAENDNQKLRGSTRFAGARLFYDPVAHEGNKNSSEEEVKRVKKIIKELTSGEITWTDKNKKTKKLTIDDILVISPYNAQVHEIAEAIPYVKAGTVDKFQGQEAPVVIFSMATSSPADAPRGMEFLYSLNRLNVAVSRARGAFILVASPKLFEPDCQSPHQMQLANALCRLGEMAK